MKLRHHFGLDADGTREFPRRSDDCSEHYKNT